MSDMLAQVTAKLFEDSAAQDEDSPVAAPTDPYADNEAISKRIDDRLRIDKNARQPFESEWFRTILYSIGEQYISRDKNGGRWRRKSLPKWLPRTITNKVVEKQNDLVAVLMRGRVPIRYFPATEDPEDLAVANLEETLRDVIYEEAGIEKIEAGLAAWVANTGNAFLVTDYDNSPEHGTIDVTQWECPACHAIVSPKDAAAKVCPECQYTGEGFAEAVGPDGQPVIKTFPVGALTADLCSPFEIRLDYTIPEFADHRYYVRLRLYDKEFAKSHWKEFATEIEQTAQPEPGTEDALTMYYLSALSRITSAFLHGTQGGQTQRTDAPKVLVYELVELPSEKFPGGLRAVRIGTSDKLVVEKGPNPHEISAGMRKGKKFLNLAHFGGEVVPGRLWRKTRLTDIIPLQNIRNVIEAAIKITIHRAAGPSWLNPIGSQVSMFTGEPCAVYDYVPISFGGTSFAKPEMVPPQLQSLHTLVMILNKIDDAIERVAGTYFLSGGDAPPNISAASALALLDERAQRAISPLIREWAKGWKEWESQAIEILRTNAVEERIHVAAGRNKKWAVTKFSKSDLQGGVNVKVDYEGVLPRSQATQRATIIQLTQMGFIQPTDPQVVTNVLAEFGLSGIRGSADKDWEEASREFRDFMESNEEPVLIPFIQNSAVHLQSHSDDTKTEEFRELRKSDPAKAQRWIQHTLAHGADLQARMQLSAEMSGAGDGKDATGQAGAQAGAQAKNGQPLGPTPDILAPAEAAPPGETPPSPVG